MKAKLISIAVLTFGLSVIAAETEALATIQSIDLSARRHHRPTTDANGNIVEKISKATKKAASFIKNKAGIVTSQAGATAWVSPKYAAKFQAYIDDLEAHGAKIKFMGGWRAGKCSSAHQHPCGKALDVCQYGRDVVDKRCLLPGRATMVQIARSHGLYEGGEWCHGDMGHVQANQSAEPCGFKTAVARRLAREEAKVYAQAEGVKVDNGNKTKPDFIGRTTRENSAKRRAKVVQVNMTSNNFDWGQRPNY